MRINTRFSVAVHAMTLMALEHIRHGDRALTSEIMALSINTNPVVIRRIMAMLKRAGLVAVKAGRGGAELTRPPKDISLLDIYNAVKTTEETALFDVHKNPNQKCYVGAYILDALDGPLSEAQKALEERLSAYTLLDVIVPVAEKNGIEIA